MKEFLQVTAIIKPSDGHLKNRYGGESGRGLETIHWLHLTPKRLKWPERFFKRHGAKAVLIARFIALFPPVAANLLAGMTTMAWRIFFNLTGSAVYTISYILIGYFFGKQWTFRSLVGAHGALPDFRGDSPHFSRRDFQTFLFHVFGPFFFQKRTQTMPRRACSAFASTPSQCTLAGARPQSMLK
jgi:hypothetical protein